MSRRLSMTACALFAGLLFSPVSSLAENPSTSSFKVLAGKQGGFNVTVVQNLIDKGDKAVSKGDLVEARKSYDKARDVSNQLLSFYRGLSGAFRGLDARIPREMDSKGRMTLQLLAKVNLRLAALFRKQNQPEVAVPLLIEVVKLVTPAKKEGQKAYQSLLELGFVETPYAGAARNLK